MEVNSFSALPLKKKNTLPESKKQLWSIEAQDYLIVLLLGLIREIGKGSRNALHSFQVAQQSKLNSLRSTYSNKNNSFNFIGPEKRQIIQVREAHNFYLGLKKQILMYLRKKRSLHFKRLKQEKMAQVRSENSIRQKREEVEPIVFNDVKEVSLNKSKFIKNNSYALKSIKSSKLKTRIRSQKTHNSSEISKLSQTLPTFVNLQQPTASTNIFQLFTQKIMILKNKLLIQKQSNQFIENSICKRMISLIFTIKAHIHDSVCIMEKITTPNTKINVVEIGNHFRYIKQLCLQENVSNQIEFEFQYFFTICDLIALVIKMMLKSPNLGTIMKNRTKEINNLFQKFSEIRCLVNYILTDLDKCEQARRSQDGRVGGICKWKMFFNKKFGNSAFKIEKFRY